MLEKHLGSLVRHFAVFSVKTPCGRPGTFQGEPGARQILPQKSLKSAIPGVGRGRLLIDVILKISRTFLDFIWLFGLSQHTSPRSPEGIGSVLKLGNRTVSPKSLYKFINMRKKETC